MRIEVHVFGSLRGYTTLAKSAGVAPEHCRALESAAFSFGQTYDPRFSETLPRQPAFFTRELRGDYRSLTQVKNGNPDDHGRATLLLITAILSQRDWDLQLCANIQSLLSSRDLWTWDGPAALPVVDVPPPSRPRVIEPGQSTRMMELVSEVERNYASGRQTIVSSADYSSTDLAILEMIIPVAARRRITTASRALKLFPSEVVALAAEASTQAVNFRPAGVLDRISPYAEVLRRAKFSSGHIPWEDIMSYRQFGQEPRVSTVAATANRPTSIERPRQSESIAPLVLLAILSVVTSSAAYLIAHSQAEQKVRQLQQENSGKIDQLNFAVRHLQDGLDGRQREAQALRDSINQKMGSLSGGIAELHGQVSKLETDFRTLQQATQDKLSSFSTRFNALERPGSAGSPPALPPSTRPATTDNSNPN